MTTLFSISTFAESVAPTLKAQIFKMPENVELAAITTAGHYILASHVVRSLTKIDKFGKIQSDIAIRWQHSEDHRTWQIWIGNETFSNGEPILASDVYVSIKRQISFKTGVHFPFAEISKISLAEDNSIKIQLTIPRADFIYDLSKPEFGVLYKSDIDAKKGLAKFSVTSGPYYLAQNSGETFYLKKNKYYKSDVRNELDLIMENSDVTESPKALATGKTDFFSTQQNLSLAAHNELKTVKNISAVKPHVAFSYWLSVNPDSAHFKTKNNRFKFQMTIKKFNGSEMNEHVWQKADQLYLPDGDGRPTAEELTKVWESIKTKAAKAVQTSKKTKLRVVPLKSMSSLIAELLEYLKADFEVEVVPYKTEDELIAILNKGNFDIKISSNDFSSIDLSENLKTTFNASRPYVFLDKNSSIKAMMTEAAQMTDKAEQSKIYKKIGLNLLSEGLIAPLAYQRVWFYHKKNLDLSTWSSISPEISMWKVSVGE